MDVSRRRYFVSTSPGSRETIRSVERLGTVESEELGP
jgi:hypothetical protein